MDPIEKHFKSLINNVNDDGTINIRLHMGEISAIMECLGFATLAAKVLGEAELKKGTTSGMRKMARIARDSQELAYLLSQHLDIGEPENSDIN